MAQTIQRCAATQHDLDAIPLSDSGWLQERMQNSRSNRTTCVLATTRGLWHNRKQMTGRESPFEQKRPKIYSRQKVAAAWFSFQQFISVLIILVATAAVYGVIAGGQWHSALDGATYAAVIGAPLVFIETYGIWLPGFATIRRWPFLASATLKSALYVAWILAGATLSNRLHHMHHAELGRVVLHRDVLAAVVLASIVVNLLLAMSRLLGAGTLRSIIIGRYHRPRREERAFVFVESATLCLLKIALVTYVFTHMWWKSSTR